MKSDKINALFLDIGGVVLTNGWETESRKRAADHFQLDFDELDTRHKMAFDTYESAKSSMDEYLDRTVFYRKRDFTRDDFKNFMYAQSAELPEKSIDFFISFKKRFELKVFALSNEPFDLNAYRIEKFGLRNLFDGFISSCYVHLRKPDSDIFRMACNISATAIENAIYVDDRLMMVEVGRSLGFKCVHYQGIDSAKQQFKDFGLAYSD
jgi:putative hydrolase of the HAD superfamily